MEGSIECCCFSSFVIGETRAVVEAVVGTLEREIGEG
jgi:hypothetical protein